MRHIAFKRGLNAKHNLLVCILLRVVHYGADITSLLTDADPFAGNPVLHDFYFFCFYFNSLISQSFYDSVLKIPHFSIVKVHNDPFPPVFTVNGLYNSVLPVLRTVVSNCRDANLVLYAPVKAGEHTMVFTTFRKVYCDKAAHYIK